MITVADLFRLGGGGYGVIISSRELFRDILAFVRLCLDCFVSQATFATPPAPPPKVVNFSLLVHAPKSAWSTSFGV